LEGRGGKKKKGEGLLWVTFLKNLLLPDPRAKGGRKKKLSVFLKEEKKERLSTARVCEERRNAGQEEKEKGKLLLRKKRRVREKRGGTPEGKSRGNRSAHGKERGAGKKKPDHVSPLPSLGEGRSEERG